MAHFKVIGSPNMNQFQKLQKKNDMLKKNGHRKSVLFHLVDVGPTIAPCETPGYFYPVEPLEALERCLKNCFKCEITVKYSFLGKQFV